MVIKSIKDDVGLGVDDLDRKDVSGNVWETTLSAQQCKRILSATGKHAVNFRQLADSAKTALLVESMKKGQWVWTDADPVRLHLHVESGEVVCSDGQHRLYAAANSGQGLRTLVLWGDAWKAGVHVDRNRNRNVAQFLQHEHGLGSASVFVAAARFHLARIASVENDLALNYSRNLVDDEAIIDTVLKDVEVLRWGINRAGQFSERGFSFTGAHVFLYELQMIRQEVAEWFYNDFLNAELDPMDPLAQLRRSTARRYDDTGVRGNAAFTLGNLVKAHNMRSGGEQVSKWHNANTTEVVFPAGFKINGKRVKAAGHE